MRPYGFESRSSTSHACFLSTMISPRRSSIICAPEPVGNFPFPRIRHLSGTAEKMGKLQCLGLATQSAAPPPAMFYLYPQGAAATDPRFSSCACRECPAALVPEGCRSGGQTPLVGYLFGARFRAVDPLLLTLDRAASKGRQ